MSNIASYQRRQSERQSHSNRLAELANANPKLDDFLHQATTIDTKLAQALEGIWCGKEGRVIAEYDPDHSVVVGWYNGKVEYAYIG